MKRVCQYSVSPEDSGARLYPLSYDKDTKAYTIKEENFQRMYDNLYLPFIEEIEKKITYSKVSKEN